MLSGTPPCDCSVCERHRNGLRLTAAGPSRRIAGCILDPARVDRQKVKCDCARGRSAFSNDERDRAEGLAAFCNDVCDRAEGRPALGTGGCARTEECASFLPARAFVRRGGRLFAPGEASVPEGGRLLLPTAAFMRRTDSFLYRRVRSCKASGGVSYRLAPFRRGSDDIFNRCAPLCDHPAGLRTPVCTGAPAGADFQTGLCSLRPALRDTASIHARSHLTLQMFVLAGAQNNSSFGAIQLPARPRSPRMHQHRRWGCTAGL
jgi:hypothetical protein